MRAKNSMKTKKQERSDSMEEVERKTERIRNTDTTGKKKQKIR